MKKTLFALFAVAALGATSAMAQDLSYNYLDGGLALYPSANGQDFIGVDVRGSHLITPEIFVFGGGSFLTDDFDYTAVHVGGGYRLPLDQQTDVYGGLSVEYQEREGIALDPTTGQLTTRSHDDTGVGLRGGLRHQLNPDLELAGQVRYITGDWDYVGIRAGVRYLLSDQLSVTGDADLWDGEFGLIGGVRYRF